MIIRKIAIEGFDEPLTVAPGVGPDEIFLVTIAIGIVCEIEPVTGPFFTVMWTQKQAIDGAFVGTGLGIRQIRFGFLRRGGKAGEIQREAAEERAGRGFRGRGNVFRVQAREEEAIDGGAAGVGGYGGMLDGFERPVLVERGAGRPGGTGFDPGLQSGDLICRKRCADGGHTRFFQAGDFAEQKTACDNVIGGSAGIEPQVSHMSAFAVAGDATLSEDGLNVAGEFNGRGSRSEQRQGAEKERKFFTKQNFGLLARDDIKPCKLAIGLAASWHPAIESLAAQPMQNVPLPVLAHSRHRGPYLALGHILYQIDLGVTPLLWIGKERTIESFRGFFAVIGDEVAPRSSSSVPICGNPCASNLPCGHIFRPVNRGDEVHGDQMSEKVVWQLLVPYAKAAGVPGIAPHDARRTCAKVCRAAGDELEQIQLLAQ